METMMEKAHKGKDRPRRKAAKRKIITPRGYGILSPEDLQKATEIFKALRERRAVSR